MSDSFSFPLPVDDASDEVLVVSGIEAGTTGGVEVVEANCHAGIDGVVILVAVSVEPDNCQAGMEGFPANDVVGVVGIEIPGPLLRSNAFKDLSSCCNSASDWV